MKNKTEQQDGSSRRNSMTIWYELLKKQLQKGGEAWRNRKKANHTGGTPRLKMMLWTSEEISEITHDKK